MMGRLARLIDGEPGEPGARTVRRMSMLVIPLTMVVNIIGAAVVFALAVFVLPFPDLENATRIVVVNAIVLAASAVVGLLIGMKWG